MAEETVFTQAQVDELIGGLKSKNTELLTANATFKTQMAGMQESLKAFEGIDPVAVKDMMAQFQNNNEQQLAKEGKWDEIAKARSAKYLEDADKKVKTAEAAAQAAIARANKFSRSVLSDALRSAALKAGVHTPALESGDVLNAGEAVFQVNEDGKPIKLENGTVVLGKDGATPYTPDEWMAEQKTIRPHWFPATNSGSPASNGGQNFAPGTKVMKRAQFEGLGPIERSKVAKEYRIVD